MSHSSLGRDVVIPVDFFCTRKCVDDEECDLPIVNVQTPLHYAVEVGNLQIVKYLTKQGSDVFMRNDSGSTPLDNAFEDEIKQHLQTVKLQKSGSRSRTLSSVEHYRRRLHQVLSESPTFRKKMSLGGEVEDGEGVGVPVGAAASAAEKRVSPEMAIRQDGLRRVQHLVDEDGDPSGQREEQQDPPLDLGQSDIPDVPATMSLSGEDEDSVGDEDEDELDIDRQHRIASPAGPGSFSVSRKLKMGGRPSKRPKTAAASSAAAAATAAAAAMMKKVVMPRRQPRGRRGRGRGRGGGRAIGGRGRPSAGTVSAAAAAVAAASVGVRPRGRGRRGRRGRTRGRTGRVGGLSRGQKHRRSRKMQRAKSAIMPRVAGLRVLREEDETKAEEEQGRRHPSLSLRRPPTKRKKGERGASSRTAVGAGVKKRAQRSTSAGRNSPIAETGEAASKFLDVRPPRVVSLVRHKRGRVSKEAEQVRRAREELHLAETKSLKHSLSIKDGEMERMRASMEKKDEFIARLQRELVVKNEVLSSILLAMRKLRVLRKDAPGSPVVSPKAGDRKKVGKGSRSPKQGSRSPGAAKKSPKQGTKSPAGRAPRDRGVAPVLHVLKGSGKQ